MYEDFRQYSFNAAYTHVLFDGWAFTIADDGSLLGALEGSINEVDGHPVNREHLQYHRRLFKEANS